MADDYDTYDLTFMQVADPLTGAQLGQGVLKVHGLSACRDRGQPCVIHSPSQHHMREWPLNWRSDTQAMERLCPHGIGHPDPDHLAYNESLTPEHDCPDRDDNGRLTDFLNDEECEFPHLEWQAVHGCDGCCAKPSEEK